MRKRGRGSRPIFKKILLPVFCLMVLQSAIFYLATVYGGIIDATDKNASDILKERVINRKNEIETRVNTKWINLNNAEENIQRIYNNLCTESKKELYQDKELQKKMLTEAAPALIRILRGNEVNGAFLILNPKKEFTPLQPGEEQETYGLCIRDYDPNSAYTAKEDLLTVRCPSSIVPDVGCSLETWWEPYYKFNDQHPGAFFYKPLKAGYDNPDVTVDNLAYFCTTHQFAETDKTVVSYSVPLIDANGYPYAVLGIEMTTSYLESLLPSDELHGHNEGAYALVQYQEGSSDYTVLAHSGILYQRAIDATNQFSTREGKNGIRDIQSSKNLSVCASFSDLEIYNKNTPFEKEHLALVGMVEKRNLYEFGKSVKKILSIVSILVLGIGMIGIFIVSQWLTVPIKRLADKVRGMDGASQMKLERINIEEIDELVNALEELSENINKNQVRTEFFSRISHDMRTPMNAIIGFSSPEILEHATEEQKDEYLKKIQSSGIYMLGLINEVLDMTKLNSERIKIREDAIPVKYFWEDTVPIIREVALQKGIHFDVQIEKEDLYVLADRQRINQVFVNLLSNAVKFTPEGGKVSFYVKVLEQDQEKITQQIIVQDNGIGMSKEFQKNMYQPFSQEHAGLTEGTGLGLSITQKLVELMNGRIACMSEEGAGTTFTVTLTNQVVQAPEIPEEDRKHICSGKEKLNGKHILVCEDHPLNIQITRKLLENLGMVVEIARNGLEGVDKFMLSAHGEYDAILMDIRMPKMDGLEATRKIRACHREDAALIPIIAMTANAFAEEVNETAEAGMNEHLAKPIDPEKLYDTLVKYIVKE